MGTVPNDIQDLIEDLRPKLTGKPEVDTHEQQPWWRARCAPGHLAPTVIPDVLQHTKPFAAGPQTPQNSAKGGPQSQNATGNLPVTKQRAFPRAAVADATRIWLRPLTRRELREYGFIDTDQP
jgi:hypothetical protein